jgi:predicted amidohydrolase
MRLALAQTQPRRGDIDANTHDHLRFVRKAKSAGADAVFFSELSLTAYETTLADSLAMEIGDERLEIFEEIAAAEHITLGLGVPVRSDGGVLISMVIFQPNTPPQVYSKQLLHGDELPYFISGRKQAVLRFEEDTLTPAICYESMQSSHLDQALALGANLYLSSVAKKAAGLASAYAYFSSAAKNHGIMILMVNAIGPCSGFDCSGSSAVWNREGELVGQLGEDAEGLLIFDTSDESVQLLEF